jgi:hypothetical protein
MIHGPERVQRAKVQTSWIKPVLGVYKQCVSQLRSLIAAEERGQFRPMDMEIDEWVPKSESK